MASETRLPDNKKIDALYVEHSSWLYQWLSQKTGCTHQAQDLTHDTFLRLFKQLEPIERPRAFLLTVAKRVLFNFWRRRDLEQAYLQALSEQDQNYALSSEELNIIYDAIVAIDNALDGLPPLVKRCFLLSRLEGHSYPEIALEIGRSQATIERYMKQAYLHCLKAAPVRL